MTDLRAELDFVLDLVASCRPIAFGFLAGGPKLLGMRHKPMGGGPITEADRALNERLTTALTERFPDDGILAEESSHEGPWRRSHRTWHIDPIDGTREFARGKRGWTIQVGLTIDGVPVLGVVDEPGAGRTSWAIAHGDHRQAMQRIGDGPFEPLQPRHASSLEEARIVGGRLYPYSRQHAIRKRLGIPHDRTSSVGSVGVRLARVARGEADLYVQAPGRTKMWDTCGPAVLVHATGGLVTDLRGQPLDYRSTKVTHPRGVLACPKALHQDVLDRLAPLTDRWL